MSLSSNEARLRAQERRSTELAAHIEELAADADTNFRGLKQDIKQLDDDMRASFLQIGDAFNLNAKACVKKGRCCLTVLTLYKHKTVK